ncbi:MAG TPA: DUF4864 domain-containing protein [Steroidobacteraceae bacterium]|nr:DUF4864 domain-containing protein [Steroidobacteraceae bacterium]
MTRVLGLVPVLLLYLGLAALAPAAHCADAGLHPKQWGAIRTVIASQLEAFKRGDAARAFSYASPAVRKQFRNASEFMRMVRADYGPVYRPQSVRFLDHFMVSRRPVQRLRLVTQDDAILILYYVIKRQRDGSWKIAGCALRRRPTVSV